MYALKHRLIIPASRHIELDLPADTPEGPAEVIVLCPVPSPEAAAGRASPEAALGPIFADMTEEEWDAFEKAMVDARKTDRWRSDEPR